MFPDLSQNDSHTDNYVNKHAAAAKLLQSCPTLRPHRRQPTRLPRPWDSPGKNTGVGCHFLLQCMKVRGESEVSQSCPTLRDSMDCSLPGSSIHGIFQARVLEWGAMRWGGRGTQFSPRRQHVGLAFCNFSSLLQKWMIFILMVLGR